MTINNKKWKKIRLAILERDCYTCAYCGGPATEVDHIIPRVLGGDESDDNLTAACVPCNRSKGARSMPKRQPNQFLRGTFPHPPAGGYLSPMRKLNPPEAGDNND